MAVVGTDLSQYPLEEHYRTCCRYICRSIDWTEISGILRKMETVSIDVSDAISLFPHLELDADYRLICYMTTEYHGIWGRVAAIPREKAGEQRCGKERTGDRPLFGYELDIPEYAAPPMEAIYNDGTAEGYFEAVLCSLFLDAIPYTRFEQEHWNRIERSLPENYDAAWDSFIAVADWTPRYSKGKLIVYRRVVENGFGSSDGKDRIYLTQFDFCTSVNDYLFWKALRTKRPIDTNHIDDSNRYGETRKCCVFTRSSVLVAVQKE